MAQLVQAPARKPRAGGIKDVVGEFIQVGHLGVADLAWEDATCGFPAQTRAGCYDTGIILYLPQRSQNSDWSIEVTRDGDTATVTVSSRVDSPSANAAFGFASPWLLADADSTGPLDEIGGTYQVNDGAYTIILLNGMTGPGTAVFTYETVPGDPGKTSSGPEPHSTVIAPFAQYAGVECFLGGDAEESYVAQAARKLEQGEDALLEYMLMQWAIGNDSSEVTASAGATRSESLVAAIGKLEATARSLYVGSPILLITADDATLAYAAGALEYVGGKLVTGLGTRVMLVTADMPGMYPVSDSPAVAMIGEPVVYVSPVKAVSSVKTTDNIGNGIAERMYAIGVDCYYATFAPIATTP